MTTAAVQGKQGKGNAFKALCKNASCNERPTFPSKLYNLLEKADNEAELSSIISWLPDGNAFKIHKPDEFIQKILKNHFSTQTQFKSFTRQVSINRIIVPVYETPESFTHELGSSSTAISLRLFENSTGGSCWGVRPYKICSSRHVILLIA
jgi:hypothetical protein